MYIILLGSSGQSSVVKDETLKIVPKPVPPIQHNRDEAKTPKERSDKVVELLQVINLFPMKS